VNLEMPVNEHGFALPFGIPFAYVMSCFHLVCLNCVFVVKGLPWTICYELFHWRLPHP